MYRVITLLLMLILMSVSVGMGSAQTSSNTVPPAPPTVWTGQFYSNPILDGEPAFVINTSTVMFDWSTTAPGPNFPADNFSVRWGANPIFAAGTYRFYLRADDSARVTIDFQNVILNTLDAPRPFDILTADVTLTQGVHHLQIDYVENSIHAVLFFSWEPLSTTQMASNSLTGLIVPPVYSISTPISNGSVNAYRLNVRTGPGLNFERFVRLLRDTGVLIIGRNADALWLKIQLADGRTGWVAARFLTTTINMRLLPVLTQ